MKPIRVLASTLSFVLTASPVAAQTVTPSAPAPQPVLTTTTTVATTPTSTPELSAYDRLSPGNRKIARALFEAQGTETTPPTTGTGATGTGGTTTTGGNLTLDQIAGLKQSGQGWGQVFKAMQSRGLVTGKNLGQVVSQYSKQHGVTRTEATTASNRVSDTGDRVASGAAGGSGARHGGGHGVSGGHGHGHAGAVSARGGDFRGNSGGHGGGHAGGHGGGHGKNK